MKGLLENEWKFYDMHVFRWLSKWMFNEKMSVTISALCDNYGQQTFADEYCEEYELSAQVLTTYR